MRSEQIKEFTTQMAESLTRMERRFAEATLIPDHLNETHPLAKTLAGTSLAQRFFNKVCFGLTECWYWRGSRNHLGYGHLGTKRAHRVAWEEFRGPIPAGMSVLHRCDVRNCVNPDHLFLGTQFQNVHDMMQKGRHRTTPQNGEKNAGAKLNEQLVRQIITEYRTTGAAQRFLAKKYNVAVMTIWRIVNRKLWPHVDV